MAPDIAEEVREFYERYPYPPPVDDLERYRHAWQDENRRRAEYSVPQLFRFIQDAGLVKDSATVFPVTLISVLVAFAFRVSAVKEQWKQIVPYAPPRDGWRASA